LLFAFLALPVAGVIQAAVTNWSTTYEVVDTEKLDVAVEVAVEAVEDANEGTDPDEDEAP
jgi:hypothetical protein